MNLENLSGSEQILPTTKSPLFRVTKTSKYLAMIIFIAMPFMGAYVGYKFIPMKVVEVEMGEGTNTVVNQVSTTGPTTANHEVFPSGKTIQLERSSSTFSDFENPVKSYLKIPSIGEDMMIEVTRLDDEYLHVVAYISIDILPSGYLRAFLVKKSTHEIVREITEGPEPVSGPNMWVSNENNQYRLVSIEGSGNEATKIVLYDYVKNIRIVLYDEKDPSVQLAKVCELGCDGNISWTGMNTQSVLFERYKKGVWPEVTYIETKEIKLPV